MEDVGYAAPRQAPPYEADPFAAYDDAGWSDSHLDLRRADEAAGLAPLMERAIGEQLAEQRLIREALLEFDRRLEVLERSTSDRLYELQHHQGERVEAFERSVNERMSAFEQVLHRIVDRLAGAEERVISGLAHNDRVVRAQLEALRPTLEATVERVTESVDQADEYTAARLAAMREMVESGLSAAAHAASESGERIAAEVSELRELIDASTEHLSSVMTHLSAVTERAEHSVSAAASTFAAPPTDDRLARIEDALGALAEMATRADAPSPTDDRLARIEDALGALAEMAARADAPSPTDDRLARIEDALADRDPGAADTGLESQLVELRDALESGIGRIGAAVEQGDQRLEAQLEIVRPTVEPAVLSGLAPLLDQALEFFRGELDDTAAALRRDMRQLAGRPAEPAAEAPPGAPMEAALVDDPPEVSAAPAPARRPRRAVPDGLRIDAAPVRSAAGRRRERPLRARREPDAD